MRAMKTASSRMRSIAKCSASFCAAFANAASPPRTDVATALHAFAGYGIELEYAIVDRGSLEPRPLAEPLLRALDSARPKRIDGVNIDWSNELVSHVVEIKNVAPV